jgi:uncharacterized protein HemX
METSAPTEKKVPEKTETSPKPPKTYKKALVGTVIALAILLIAAGVFGTLYYFKVQDVKKLTAEKQELLGQKGDLEGKMGELSQTSTEIAGLNDQIKSFKAKIAKANAYNEFSKYLNSVIQAHSGFTGWIDAEYQIGRTKAQATGDKSFVSVVDWAWNTQNGDPLNRVVTTLKAIDSGIEASLK